jgi:hypothetical protein
MNSRDAIKERGRSLEEEWAQRQAQEAVARLRSRTDTGEDCQRLAERTGITSSDLLHRMRALGFDGDSIALLFLVPFVGMAGADGSVSHAERALVKELARGDDVLPGTRAWAILDGWLLEPPPPATLDAMLQLLADVLAVTPAEEAEARRERIRTTLARVGEASGGMWGIGALSRAERRFAAMVEDRL